MVTIRGFSKSDEERLREIAARALTFDPYKIDARLPQEKTDAYFRERISKSIEKAKEDPSKRFILVADRDMVLGYIMLRIDEELSRVYDLTWASLDSLAVDPDYHNQGIGNLLVKEGLSLLKRKGVEYVEVLAAQNNVPSIVVYEKNGFRVVQLDMMLRQYL